MILSLVKTGQIVVFLLILRVTILQGWSAEDIVEINFCLGQQPLQLTQCQCDDERYRLGKFISIIIVTIIIVVVVILILMMIIITSYYQWQL